MTISNPDPIKTSPLVARARAILMTPAAEWDKIDVEPATVQGLYVGYVCLLAAIPAVAGLIGGLVFGHGAFGIVYRPSIVTAVIGAVVGYGLALAMVFILGLVVNALAPNFGGQPNQIQAFKVAAYSGTAGWVAGVLSIFPPLAPLVFLGSLYGLYLLYLGLPKLMKAPQEKALGYTVVTIIVAVLLAVVVSTVTGALAGGAMIGAGGLAGGDRGQISGTLRVPGGSVDLGKLEAASRALQASANQVQAQQAGAPPPAGSVKALPAETLKGLLPSALSSGYDRVEVSSASAGAAGMAGAQAIGVYAKGDSRITLQINDLAAAGALASLAGAVNVESSRETASGYEKVGKVDGRMTTETLDRSSKHGRYSVVVADRFVVEAEGTGMGIDDLKAAVQAIGFSKLEALAKG